MGEVYPDLYAAVGVHSGLACGAASDMPSAFTAMRQGGASRHARDQAGSRRPVPTIVFHGDQDKTVNPVNGDQVVAQFKAAAGPLGSEVTRGSAPDGLSYTRTVQAGSDGQPFLEQWLVHGAAHAWSGGNRNGSYTEPRGPDASREMLRFFLAHSNAVSASSELVEA
jgi:poly(3-hydroxybutyrate) depolymerase